MARQDFFNEPLPDLEQQLAAVLGGASWAVVVFAPEDEAWCDWIYRNVNGYPLPASLVDRVTSQGQPRPDCLSVFPDRGDPTYQDHVAEAVENGTFLIVVCSPHSAHCAAVDEQIRAFKNGGGEERILALVADGPPAADLGEQRRAAECAWVPSWLRWRLEEDGFRAVECSEPRVIDARRGYRSLKQVRDGLLTALMDADAGELERLGSFSRKVEPVPIPEPPQAQNNAAKMGAVAPMLPASTPRRGSTFSIGMAVTLIVVAAVFGTRSFLEITAEEPASTLDAGAVTGVPGDRSTQATPVEEPSPGTEAALPSTDAAPAPVALQSAPPLAEPAPVESTAAPVAGAPAQRAPAQIARPNVPQVAPPPAWATSRIQPTDVPTDVPTDAPTGVPAVPRSAPGLPAMAYVAPTLSASYSGTASSAAFAESDAVLLDEVHALERRGDETMAEKRTEDALDLYHTALVSAQEYAMRKTASPNARDQIVKLERKLGTLQLQNASTAEARATYLQARKSLLLLKSQGQWSRERAKSLDEIESRILSLPRD